MDKAGFVTDISPLGRRKNGNTKMLEKEKGHGQWCEEEVNPIAWWTRGKWSQCMGPLEESWRQIEIAWDMALRNPSGARVRPANEIL